MCVHEIYNFLTHNKQAVCPDSKMNNAIIERIFDFTSLTLSHINFTVYCYSSNVNKLCLFKKKYYDYSQ